VNVSAVVKEGYREEAVGNLRRREYEATPHTKLEMYEYYNRQLPTYIKVWGREGRINYGYWEAGDTFKEAQYRQAERLASMAHLTPDSVVLDFGCGTGVNCFYLARRFGCRVLGLDISVGVLRQARTVLATEHQDIFHLVSFYEGTLDDLIETMAGGYLDATTGAVQPPFTHMWSTLVNFQVRHRDRANLFKSFNKISTLDAYLVMDDAV